MSCKSVLNNSIRSGGESFRQNSVHEKLYSTPSSEEKIKFAGDESKDRLYEPKQNKKMVRVLTVIIYVFSVSLAAIVLSLYYGFFWTAPPYTPTSSPSQLAQISDHVTSNKTACSCVDSHDGHSHTTVETAPVDTSTFPFQLDNSFNVIEDEIFPSTNTESLNDTNQASTPSATSTFDTSTINSVKLNNLLLKKITKSVLSSKTSNDT